MSNVLIVNAGVRRTTGEGGALNAEMVRIAREAFTKAGLSVVETNLNEPWTLDAEVEKVANARLILVQTPVWAMSAPWQYIK